VIELLKKISQGDRRALARAISLVESGDPSGTDVLKACYPEDWRSFVIGVTGAPGVGKSTLISQLTDRYLDDDVSVGIIGVDPTSPFSGGAMLGDRIRMEKHNLDPRVFIRSMATRDRNTSLPKRVRGIIRLLNLSGKDIIIVESVGVGQADLDIKNVADLVIVVLTPGMGDSIQFLKAGLMEIADIFVINKSDHSGLDNILQDLNEIGESGDGDPLGLRVVVTTQSLNGEGVVKLKQSIQAYRERLASSGMLKQNREDQRSVEFLELVFQELKLRLKDDIYNDTRFKEVFQKVRKGDIEPYSAALSFLEPGFY
jgi:LAO/AO transport system kinase